MLSKLLRVVYAVVALKGAFAAIAPRKALKLDLKWLSVSLKNVGELEPRDWYVTATRATGVGLLAAGAVGFLLTGDSEDAPEPESTGDDEVDPIDISPETLDSDDESTDESAA